jgi:hypothetical protein
VRRTFGSSDQAGSLAGVERRTTMGDRGGIYIGGGTLIIIILLLIIFL